MIKAAQISVDFVFNLKAIPRVSVYVAFIVTFQIIIVQHMHSVSGSAHRNLCAVKKRLSGEVWQECANNNVDCCKWVEFFAVPFTHKLLWNSRDRLHKKMQKRAKNHSKHRCNNEAKYERDDRRKKSLQLNELRVLSWRFLLFSFSFHLPSMDGTWHKQQQRCKTAYTQINATVARITSAIGTNQWLPCEIISH